MAAARREFVTAINIFRSTSNTEGLAWTLFATSGLLRQQSQYSQALAALQNSLALAYLCRDHGLAAYSLAGIAETTRIVGNYSLARHQHLEAFRQFRALDDIRGAVWALEGIGQMLKNRGHVDDARRHFAKAKKLALGSNDARGFAYAIKCHAECLAKLGHPATALEEASLAVDLFGRLGLKVGLGYALKSLGDVLQRQNQDVRALESYREAAEVFQQTRDLRGGAYTLNAMATLHISVGEARAAAILLAHASGYFHRNHVGFGLAQNAAAVAQIRTRKMLNTRAWAEIDHGVSSAVSPVAIILPTI